MKMKTKLFAFLAVALMLALPLAAFVPSADADSDSNDSIDDIADLQPIDLPEGFENGLEDGDAMLLGDSRATGVLEGMYPGSWTWDRTTGLGPYNSFYGAFDIDDGNRFIGVLDPYNLKQLVDGTPLSETGHFNIMWVLPTVYWSVDANGNLELSSDPTKGTAYAHTVDGHTYKYIAYGVYEATPNDDGTATTTITSESGKTPIRNTSATNLRNYARANDVSELGTNAYAMIWNFYMWELYKYISFTNMEDFNSQKVVGLGKVSWTNGTPINTGLSDELGPYAGLITDSNTPTTTEQNQPVKLYLENAWGSNIEFVDGVVLNSSKMYVDTQHDFDLNGGSNPTTGPYTVEIPISIAMSSTSPYYVWPSEISTDERTWGIGLTPNGSNNSGLADAYNGIVGSTGMSFISCGGRDTTSSTQLFGTGISLIHLGSTSISNAHTGTRIAFVFDQDLVTFTPASYDYVLNYDPTLMATTSKAISVEGMDPISHNAYTVTVESADSEFGTVEPTEIQNVSEGSEVYIDGNTLTIGETVIIATPAEGYRLASWSVATGDVITSDTTITATFELIPVPEPVENKLIKLIPLIIIIALTVIAAMALMSFTGNGIDLIKLLIGLTVCVLFVAMAMIPAVGGF